MSCCDLAIPPSAEVIDDLAEARIRAAAREVGPDLVQSEFHIPGMHCIGCVQSIERGLNALAFVESARANLSARRVRVTWRPDAGEGVVLSETLDRLGHAHALLQPGAETDDEDRRHRHLLMCLGVAGFAAANVMLLSVSVWSGADAETRQIFHLISGLIAIPAALVAGRPFFASALGALAHRRLNMDVPISLAVVLALAMSVVESLRGGAHAYFDAALMLLFFLLIGRVLDNMMRKRARKAVTTLNALAAKGATEVLPDGTRRYVDVDEVTPGTHVFVAAGERIPVDGIVIDGASEVDRGLVTGESASITVRDGTEVEAGTLNLTGPLTLRATKPAASSFLGEVIRLMEAAEGGRSRFVRIADRVAQLYAPAVHVLALSAFVGWLIATGGDWRTSAYTAIAVLIVTCPCALGLAVPIVQVVAAGRLFERGILIKDGGALERLAHVDTAVFDKTGTLTLGRPTVRSSDATAAQWALAAALAAGSRHPASLAVKAAAPHSGTAKAVAPTGIREVAGFGVEADFDGRRVRLGSRDWVAEIAPVRDTLHDDHAPVFLAEDGGPVARFGLVDAVRDGTRQALDALRAQGLTLAISSGDDIGPVRAVARELDIAQFAARQRPADKIATITALQADGGRILMVGDGLNDGPALAAADVSIAPSSGSDVGRQAADLVFTGQSLDAIPFALDVSRRADRLVRQNFGLAVAYNAIAVPLACLGHVTPLVAAIAMSASSIVVVANSLRLRLGGQRTTVTDVRRTQDAGVPHRGVATTAALGQGSAEGAT